jgi:antitoxin component of MazEF toxin-antitoxin module
MNTSIQKVIKIGSSAGVTIPAKDLKRSGIKVGDEIEVTYKPNVKQASDKQVMDSAKKILKKYSKDFVNLAKR